MIAEEQKRIREFVIPTEQEQVTEVAETIPEEPEPKTPDDQLKEELKTRGITIEDLLKGLRQSDNPE